MNYYFVRGGEFIFNDELTTYHLIYIQQWHPKLPPPDQSNLSPGKHVKDVHAPLPYPPAQTQSDNFQYQPRDQIPHMVKNEVPDPDGHTHHHR